MTVAVTLTDGTTDEMVENIDSVRIDSGIGVADNTVSVVVADRLDGTQIDKTLTLPTGDYTIQSVNYDPDTEQSTILGRQAIDEPALVAQLIRSAGGVVNTLASTRGGVWELRGASAAGVSLDEYRMLDVGTRYTSLWNYMVADITGATTLSQIQTGLGKHLLAPDIRGGVGVVVASYATEGELTIENDDLLVGAKVDFNRPGGGTTTPAEVATRYTARYNFFETAWELSPGDTVGARTVLPDVYSTLLDAMQAIGERVVADILNGASMTVVVPLDLTIMPRMAVTVGSGVFSDAQTETQWQATKISHRVGSGSRPDSTVITLRPRYDDASAVTFWNALIEQTRPGALTNIREGTVTGSLIQVLFDPAISGGAAETLEVRFLSGTTVLATVVLPSRGKTGQPTAGFKYIDTRAGTRYEFEVTPRNAIGDGPTGSIPVTTKTNVAPSPGSVTVVSLDDYADALNMDNADQRIAQVLSRGLYAEGAGPSLPVDPDEYNILLADATSSSYQGVLGAGFGAAGAAVTPLVTEELSKRAVTVGCSTYCSSIASNVGRNFASYAQLQVLSQLAGGGGGFAASTAGLGGGTAYRVVDTTTLRFAILGNLSRGALRGLGLISAALSTAATIISIVNLLTLPYTAYQILVLVDAIETLLTQPPENPGLVMFAFEGNGYPVVSSELWVRSRLINPDNSHGPWGGWTSYDYRETTAYPVGSAGRIRYLSGTTAADRRAGLQAFAVSFSTTPHQMQLAMRLRMEVDQGGTRLYSGQGEPSSTVSVPNSPPVSLSADNPVSGGWLATPPMDIFTFS